MVNLWISEQKTFWTDDVVKYIQNNSTIKNIYNIIVQWICNYVQGVQKVMHIVISLGFCGMIPSSSAIVLGNMVAKATENVCFSWGGFWSVGRVSESGTRLQHSRTIPGNILTHFSVTNFLSSNSLQYQPNYHKQDILITTSKIPHHLLQPQIINP